jgi:serine/threonine protein kinase
MEREVAIKVILDIALDVPEIKERFYREARTAGQLTHENITIGKNIIHRDSKPSTNRDDEGRVVTP